MKKFVMASQGNSAVGVERNTLAEQSHYTNNILKQADVIIKSLTTGKPSISKRLVL